LVLHQDASGHVTFFHNAVLSIGDQLIDIAEGGIKAEGVGL